MNRSIRRLYLAMAAGFGLLILLLGYWQVIAANGLDDRPGNPRIVQREREIDRGRIISADGVVLAYSRAVRVQGKRVFERVYPHGELAPHVVGYTSATQGQTGLESTWNRYLAGSYGTQPLLQRLNLSDKQGADIHITLNTKVQRAADDALSGQTGAVVALNAKTGAVLAMSSSPTYDLANVATAFDAIRKEAGAPLLNRATAGRYPPGSTFKAVTAAEALDSGLYTPESQFDDTGSYVVHGQTIRNFGGETFGANSLSDALTFSINTTFAKIGAALGPQRLGGAMDRLGFGTRPPIDLPQGEVLPSGRVGPNGGLLPNDQPGEDTSRIAIGQERLGVTPLQMAMVAQAVANNGVLRAPYLLTKAVDRGGSIVHLQNPHDIGQAMKPETASSLNAMMRRVVEEGTGTAAALFGLQVAGKTGTAETGNANLNDAWFIGFAPATDPEVAVAVVVENTPGQGGVVAAPIAAKVMKAAIGANG